MPKNPNIKKVLVIGSGPIVIGQAAEFDYAGTQACRSLKEEGIEVVLVNSNPATIMTDKALADHIYLEPLTEETVKRIIEKERPDSILCGLGGQTGLTIGMQLAKDGYLDKMGVTLLGTDAEAIDKAEDRQMFRDTMVKINQPVVPSDIAYTVGHAKEIADEIGYPVIIRPAFTLGGAGGGVGAAVSGAKKAALSTSTVFSSGGRWPRWMCRVLSSSVWEREVSSNIGILLFDTSSGKGHDGQNSPCRQAGGRLILLRDPAKAFTDVVRAGGINEPCRAVLDLDVHRQIAGVDVIDGILVQRELLHRNGLIQLQKCLYLCSCCCAVWCSVCT